ncbi:RUN domain-containing protein 3B-like [Gigantopelta aegis]|uniref:RUN domain-containing protein 3B-like n=1 Tax=Gigantopelta aegis TaxID=1735272 RepID=UPI001B88A965|nr:RUN domain-containing protein 3B-like [Gigantopelta aegis]
MEETRNRNLPNIKLANRQLDVIRRNLVCVCRFAIKNLIDRACFVNIDDDCEEFLNFCAVMEQVLLHHIKPQKTWYGGVDSNFWNYIATACHRIPNSCISSIGAIENIKSPAAKGRAFIRCALMEKRLSEYISAALKQPKLTRKFYKDGAIMLSDDANVLCGILLGLNAIDFSFCLKGENSDLLGPLAVDYTPFLKFHQSSESVSHDLEEMRELSNSSLSSSIMSEDVDEVTGTKMKLAALQQKYRSIVEQKGYLEELVRLRDQQNKELQGQQQSLFDQLHRVEVTGQREHRQLENVILELQGQLAAAKSEHRLLQHRLSLLTLQRHTDGHSTREIQMMEMAGDADSLKRHFTDSLNDQHSVTSSTEMQHHPYLQNDSRSQISDTSSQFTSQEDSHSLIPLAGSLTEVPIHSSDSDQPTDDRQRPVINVQEARPSDTPESGPSKKVAPESGTSAAGVKDAADVKDEVFHDTSSPDTAVAVVPSQGASPSAAPEMESGSVQKVAADGGSSDDAVEDEELDSGAKDGSDVQDRMNVNQYYSLTTVEAMEEDDDDDDDGNDHHVNDGGGGDVVEKSKIHDSETSDSQSNAKDSKTSVDEEPQLTRDIEKSASTNTSELEQNLDESGSKSSADGGEDPVKHEAEGKASGKEEKAVSEAEITETSASEMLQTPLKEMLKSSSSDGSEPVHIQRLEESSSSDDKDPWEMVATGNGNGGKSSDENMENIDESSPVVSISEELLAHGEVVENIPEQKNTDQ